MADHVDRVLAQWHAERPDLDVSPMAVIGRLARLSALVDAELRRTFARHGLDRATFDVLATLRRSGPPYRLTPTELMRSAMVTSGAITQRLDKMEARGLVERTPNEADGRGVRVQLTEAGGEVIDRALLGDDELVASGMTPTQREVELALRACREIGIEHAPRTISCGAAG